MAPGELQPVRPRLVDLAEPDEQVVDRVAGREAADHHRAGADPVVEVEVAQVDVEGVVEALEDAELVVQAGDPAARRVDRLLAALSLDEHLAAQRPERLDELVARRLRARAVVRGQRDVAQAGADVPLAQGEDQVVGARLVGVADQGDDPAERVAPLAVGLAPQRVEEGEHGVLVARRADGRSPGRCRQSTTTRL